MRRAPIDPTMRRLRVARLVALAALLLAPPLVAPLLVTPLFADAGGYDPAAIAPFPPPLESYGDAGVAGLWGVLAGRVAAQPLNLWATVLFVGAILHTFFTHQFRRIANDLQERQDERARRAAGVAPAAAVRRVSALARLFHFLGEVEAVFGIWVLPLLVVMAGFIGRDATLAYVNHRVNFTEPIFVVVVMAIASTRPVLSLAERAMGLLAGVGRHTPAAWWISILTVGPLLGSFITEPAAMTICASLLSRKIYSRHPGKGLAYGTLGLLFVAVSAGGTLTHFAAPPVLMVARPWGWGLAHMLEHFGWKAALGIALSVGAYYLYFHRELNRLRTVRDDLPAGAPEMAIPAWVTIGHVAFLAVTVALAHFPVLLVFTLLIFLAFVQMTEDFQRDFRLISPVLVGFFLAGLVVHGGLQQWWIAPVLGRLGEVPLMLGATVLTAFNDNAAITYLATLVPTFSEGMKYAVVAGAVTGGGLTVIANAPNPAGQSILNKHFEDGIGAAGLFLGALIPTIVVLACFLFFR